MTSLFEVIGHVVRVTSRIYGSKPSIAFVLKLQDGREFKANCNFFCPVEEGDGLRGVVTLMADQSIHFTQRPFVQIPISPDQIQGCFIRALYKYKLSGSQAATLYKTFLERSQTHNAHLKRIAEFKAKAASAATPPAAGGDTKESDEKRMIRDTISGPSGVLAYITKLATEYHERRDPDMITELASTTKLAEEPIVDLLRWWRQHRALRCLFLLGLTRKEIRACHHSLDEIYEICMLRPLALPMISKEKALEIMTMMGRTPSAVDLMCGDIVRFVYSKNIEFAWAATPLWMLVKTFRTILDLRDLLVSDYDLVFWTNPLRAEESLVYLKYSYQVEVSVADWIDRLIKKTAQEATTPPPPVDGVSYVCKTLTDEQKAAIQGALRHHICIISGIPGSGKTASIKDFIHNLKICNIEHMQGSFTGKAVARLQTMIGERSAATMDRMIVQQSRYSEFDVFIADECSMITTELMYRFRCAFPHDFRLILVGDENQLQPIGPGSFMKQLIASGRVPIYRLTANQRLITEGKENIILDNANMLIDPRRNWEYPVNFKEGTAFAQLDGGINAVVSIVTTLHKAGIPDDKICCITPYNEHLPALNGLFQQLYRKDDNSVVDSSQRRWWVNDRVRMLVNKSVFNIYNGDCGRASEITKDGLKVKFSDEAEHLFLFESKKQWAHDEIDLMNDNELTVEMLTPCYAVTVDSSQGDEYEWVVIFIPDKRTKDGRVSSFLNINRLYTAITRTRRAVWLVGSEHTIGEASRKRAPYRYEGLAPRLVLTKDVKAEAILEKVTAPPAAPPSAAAPPEYSADDLANIHDDPGLYE